MPSKRISLGPFDLFDWGGSIAVERKKKREKKETGCGRVVRKVDIYCRLITRL
jgi:hypothetical protein